MQEVDRNSEFIDRLYVNQQRYGFFQPRQELIGILSKIGQGIRSVLNINITSIKRARQIIENIIPITEKAFQ